MRSSWVPGVGRVTQPTWLAKGEGEGRTPRRDFPGGDDRGVVVGWTRPATAMTALMEAAPGETVECSEEEYREEAYRKADIVQAVINDPAVLTDLERLVVQLKFFGHKSWRDSEEIMRALREEGVSPSEGVAKSYLQRVGSRAEQKLKAALESRMSEIYPTLECE